MESQDTKIRPLFQRDGVDYYRFSYEKEGNTIMLESPATIQAFCKLMIEVFKNELTNELAGGFLPISGTSYYDDGTSRDFTLTSYVVRDVANNENSVSSLSEVIF